MTSVTMYPTLGTVAPYVLPKHELANWLKIESLAKDETKLFQKTLLYLDAFANNDEPIPFPSSLPEAQRIKLVFRKSESWSTVEKLLFKADLQDKDPLTATFNNFLREKISTLREENHHLQQTVETIQSLMIQLDNFGNPLLKKTKAEIIKMKGIDNLLKEAEKVYQTQVGAIATLASSFFDYIDKLTPASIPLVSQPAVEFLKGKWENLTLFLQWHEVKMDVSKVWLRTDILPDDGKKIKIDGLTNACTLAVMVFRQKERYTQPVWVGSKKFKKVRTKEISITHSEYYSPNKKISTDAAAVKEIANLARFALNKCLLKEYSGSTSLLSYYLGGIFTPVPLVLVR